MFTMADIYWIHYPEHTNPLTEGYVGITVDLEARMKLHKRCANNNPTNPMHNELVGMRSSDLIVEIIFNGSEHECTVEEKRLRPKPKIGWNSATGGGYDPRTAEEKSLRKQLRENFI